ncbi:N-acetylmuramoyl-L-alanine amidase [Bacillus manliponensis]|uniref:N-acetylmuramoyl-L-alanine amidase n=1 Tax=Bacillus manliponensis TaxID=574376 RepID=A0A073K4D2_9BACI|nr:N-acetylmuramoyl-L-alanine amidase [Bacillus manliponensis]
MKKFKIASCVLAGLMAFSGVTPMVSAEKVEDVKAKINTENETLNKQKQERDELQKQMNGLNKTIEGLDKSIVENEQKLNETLKQVADAEKLIEEKNKTIAELQTKIAEREELLKGRLAALQEQPKSNIVTDVVVNSTSIADLVSRLTSVSQIMQSDKEIMEMQKKDQDSIKKDVETVKTKQEELKKAQTEIEAVKQELDTKKAEQQTAVNDLTAKMDVVVNELESTEAQVKELEKQALYLQSLAEKEMRQQEAQQATAAAPANNGGGQAQAPANNGGGQAQAPAAKPAAPAAPASNASGVVAKAQQYIGVPYVWGGASPSGFDCSGFISYVYGVGRQTAAGFYSSATKVSSPQPGDLVFFANTYKKGISHIGIVVGDGTMIHAGPSGIAVSNLSNSYNQKHFAGYGRL